MRLAQFISVLATLVCASLAHSQGPVTLSPVVNLSRSTDSSYFLTLGGTLVSTRGTSNVKVRFTGNHPCWLYQIANEPENWSGTAMAVMTLTNYEKFPVTVCVNISSSTDPSDLSVAFSAPVTLAAQQTVRYGFSFDLPDPVQYGMEALPPPAGNPVTYVFSRSQLNLAKVGHWRISYQGTAPATIGLSEYDLATYSPGFPDLVDQWFQWTGRDWTNKIHSATDLKTQMADERTDLALNPGTGETSGSARLPNQGAAGKWRVTSYNGMKYLVHPSGRLFWMFGLTGVHDAYGTMVSNRRQMFESLPPDSGTTASLYADHVANRGPSGTDIYDQRWNLMQKYGQNYLPSFVSTLKERLPSWGFNTVGAWSFDRVNDGSLPFTVCLNTNSFPVRLSTPNITWTSLPDPYSSQFQTWLNSTFTNQLATYNTRTNFAGVFVDNEMSWGSPTTADPNGTTTFALAALSASSSQPARAAFLKQLESTYRTVGSLNSAWHTKYSSFATVTAPTTLTSAATQDCTKFEEAFALTYFDAVKTALKAANFKGLYLGCRFDQYNSAVVSAASQVVDVLSFNHYGTADTYPWAYFNSLSKPVLLSESSVGENAEGNFAGNPLAPDVNTRAQWASAILSEAAKQPNVVGLDWFNFSDWAATADGDSMENFGYGVVDVCDTPHYQLVNAFRAFAKQLYQLRG